MKREHRQKALILTKFSTYIGNVRSVIGDTKWNEGNGVFRPAIISYPIIIPLVWRKRAEAIIARTINLGIMAKKTMMK